MADKTGIEWTDATWNPIRGCSRVSEGCRNCYAEKVAHRFRGPGQAYDGLTSIVNGHAVWNGTVEFVANHLLDPLRWKKPRRIFVNSMSDLFHENVTDAMLDRIFAVMALCPQHTFQILTKRPERMLAYMSSSGLADRISLAIFALPEKDVDRCAAVVPTEGDVLLPNVHLGVSVENQKAADERIPLLLQTPAAKRFISAEPLLGEVDLKHSLWVAWQCSGCRFYFGGGLQRMCPRCGRRDYWSGSHAFNPKGGQVGSGLDWVIVGGESGTGARPMHPDWARSLRDHCKAAGVPFFFKQWGEWSPCDGYGDEADSISRSIILNRKRSKMHGVGTDEIPSYVFRVGKKAAGALLDGVEYREFPA